MLAQADLRMFGQNLFLIIGGVLLLALLLFLGFVAWTGLNMLVFYAGKRRAEREHVRQTRRADGELYPPMIEGICEVCKRGGHKIYFPEVGMAMCSPCYERSWREQKEKSWPATDMASMAEPAEKVPDTDENGADTISPVTGALTIAVS